jgi:hypothetical protein
MFASRPWLMAVRVVILLSGGRATIHAHQDSCPRLHSCPSGGHTDVCGDQGRCEHCPDTPYCLAGQPRPAASSPAAPTPATPMPNQPLAPPR